jgi:hypothetical protein
MRRWEAVASTAATALGLPIGLAALSACALGSALWFTATDEALRSAGAYATPSAATTAALAAETMCIELVVGVGMLISVRQPGQPVGWLLLVGGGLMSLGNLGEAYAIHGFAAEPSVLPGSAVAAWIGNLSWGPAIVALGVALLLFPSGRVVSATWARVVWLALAVTALVTGLMAIRPGPLPLTLAIQNPLAVDPVGEIPIRLLNVAYGLSVGAFPALAAGSIVLRYRHGTPVEQLQLKWVAGAVTIFAIAFGALALRGPWDSASDVGLFVALSLTPVAIGIAITRYRLYAIDAIIRRTLLYGALSVALGGCYFGGVVLFQALLHPVTGQDTIAVAAATLLIAGVFRPLRGRIQVVIDRRFYRLRYDATQATSTLSARLGHEVDLDVIEADLVGAVSETMQPEHVAVWLRPTLRTSR